VAEVVAAYAVPHTPSFIADVAERGAASETLEFFQTIKRHLDAARLDLLLMIQNDHFNTFFFDNWPTFAIGVGDSGTGPSDQTPAMPNYEVAMQSDLAREIHAHCVASDFDFSSSEEMTLDHAVLVPLHFLTPEMKLPIVPVFINCLVPPLPSARRCHLLGKRIGEAIRRWDSPARVGVLASGSLSLEIGGPRAEPGRTFGVPDREWAAWILECVRDVRHEELIAAATPQRMADAGNVAAELLNWIALVGLVGQQQPDLVINQPELGNAFAAWRLEQGRP
jgi:hypothetical protein